MKKLSVLVFILALSGVLWLANSEIRKQDTQTPFKANILGADIVQNTQPPSKPKKMAPADLTISAVNLEKKGDPKPGYNMYEFDAQITVKNLGGAVRNAAVKIQSNNNAYLQTGLLNLNHEEEVVLKGFPIFLDGDLNGFAIDFALESPADSNEKNNLYAMNWFELPPKISDLELSFDFDTKEASLSYQLDPQLLDDQVEIVWQEAENLNLRGTQYYEASLRDRRVAYFKKEISWSVLDDNGWFSKVINQEELADFRAEEWEGKYFYLKVTEKETGDYAVSDLFGVAKNTDLNKAELAEAFLKAVGEDFTGGAVEKLYELGVLNESELLIYTEDMPAYREDVLRLAANYFEWDFTDFAEIKRFVDVGEESEMYIYAQTFAKNEAAEFLGDYLQLGRQASVEFVNFIVNANK